MKRRLPGSRLHYFIGRPDWTPLVDVLFLLLIFFMISSSFVQVSGIKVDLPRVGATSTLGIEKSVITVSKSGEKWIISFNDRLVPDWEQLKAQMAEVRNTTNTKTVILRADRKVPFKIISKIMVMAERNKLSVFVVTLPKKVSKATRFNP